MRKSQFTDEQMVGMIREVDRDAVADVAKRRGISEQTIYAWRERFGAGERSLDQLRSRRWRSRNAM